MMRVVATAKGYLGSLREVGDEFDVPKGMTASWFIPAGTEAEMKPAVETKLAVKAKRKGAEPEPAGDEAADAI